jgi:hypothetical protein
VFFFCSFIRHIAEYIMEVQGKTAPSGDPRRPLDTASGGADVRRVGPPPHATNGQPGDESPLHTPSPQWGFYVPITPPEQEMYSKQAVQNMGKTIANAANAPSTQKK